MPDPVDGDKKWLNVPDRIWNLLFVAIATAIVSYFSNRTKTAVDEHAAVSMIHQEEMKTQQEDVKTAVAAVKVAVDEKAADIKETVQAVPRATAEAVQATPPN